jgi:uncharacterized protein (TIGR02246 family)
MKRVVIVLAFVVAASALAFGQGGNVEQSLKALTEEWRQASLKGDAATFDKQLADDHIGVNVLGVTRTKAQILENLKSGKGAQYEALDVSDIRVRVYGDTALVNYTANVKGHFGDTDISGQWRVVRVFVKRKGKWQSVSFQATRVAQQP